MLRRNAEIHPTRFAPFGSNPAETDSQATVACSWCCLQDVCLACGLNGRARAPLDDLVTTKRRIAKERAVYRSGERFEFLYAVRSGAFKSVAHSLHGDEKVVGFHLPRDVLGLDAISTGRHGYGAVALEDSEVCAIPFAALTKLSLAKPMLQRQILHMLSGDICRDQGLMLLLGNMAAEQRLAAFLLSLSDRYHRLGFAADRFVLRMTRDEIGSYLGLTLETVSRVLSRFQRQGLIGVHQREIELKEAGTLRDLVGR